MANRPLELLEVREGEVKSLTLTVGQLRDESRVGIRELLQVERPLSSSTQPRILPRTHSIPFHLGPARGVIFPSKILLFAHPSLSSIPITETAAMLAEHLQKVDSAHHPFEFKALEGLLWTMASRQEKRIAYVSRVLTAVMHHSSTHTDEDASEDSPLNQLLPLSTTLGHYELVSRGLLQCVESLMSDPYDLRLAATLSSSEDTKETRGGEMVEQLEDMLEAVHHSASGTLIAAGEMTRQLSIKRDLLQLQQRAHQNMLLSTNLHLQRACIGLSAAMWFTSIFGQNFDHGLGLFGKEALLCSTFLSAMTGVFMFQYFGKGRGGGWGGNPAHAPRLESLQLFLLQLDIRLDGAKGTLASAKRILEGGGGRTPRA